MRYSTIIANLINIVTFIIIICSSLIPFALHYFIGVEFNSLAIFIIGTVCFVSLFVLLSRLILGARRVRVLNNPYLDYLEKHGHFIVVSKQLFRMENRITVRALRDDVTHYRHSVTWSGRGPATPTDCDSDIDVNIRSINKRGRPAYEVCVSFSNPLKKNEEKTFYYSYEMDGNIVEPEPYIMQVISKRAPRLNSTFVVEFSKNITPVNIVHAVFATRTRTHPIKRSVVDLPPGRIFHLYEQPIVNYTYCINWDYMQ